MANEKYYTLMGQTLSIADWARKYGIKPNTLHKRLSGGMEFKDALFKPKDNAKRILVSGKSATIKEIAKSAGVSYHTVYARKRRGWKKDELLSRGLRQLHITAFGKTQTPKEWSEETGLHVWVIHNRLQRGWTPEETFSTLSKRKRRDSQLKKHEAFGEKKTLKQWATDRNMAYRTLVSRLHKGLPLEVALKLPTKRTK